MAARYARLAIALAMVTACAHVHNTLLDHPVALSELGGKTAAREAITVESARGLLEVFLDGGEIHVLDPGHQASRVDDRVTIHIADHQYVIRDGQQSRVVTGVTADYPPQLSPDHTKFVVEQWAAEPRKNELVVVTIADAKLQHFAVDEPERGYAARWSRDGAAVWFYTGTGPHRIELASGAITAVDHVDPADLADAQAPDPSVCPARGLRLVIERTGDRQLIVLESLPTSSDPDHLSSLQRRTLVQATDKPHGQETDPFPGGFGDTLFTASCDRFVFTFEEQVYVGSVATGRFAYLTAGTHASLLLPNAR
jgi:hypothetical protein